jgi:hypothetical protein
VIALACSCGKKNGRSVDADVEDQLSEEDVALDEVEDVDDDGVDVDEEEAPPIPGPRLYSAESESSTSVRLTFNELLADDADDPRHFRITPPIWVEDAEFGSTRDIVVLTTETQTNHEFYTVQVLREDMNDDGVIDALDNLLTNEAGIPIDPAFDRTGFVGISDEVYVIVDVMVTDNRGSVPADYTGLSGSSCTEPYIPGEVGERHSSTDVNLGIGGTDTSIWVRYDRLPITSTTPVLTGIAVKHWTDWVASCPEGWVRASGASSGIPGALTTGTWGSCWRNGLCVRYEPLEDVETFVSNACYSWTGSPGPACPGLCYSNDAGWLMYPDDQDIHQGCGDGQWVKICANRAYLWPPMPPEVDLTDVEKLDLVTMYAPRIWMAEGEAYMPSSVEWAFPEQERYLNGDGNYWLRTRDSLPEPSSVLPFFYGDLDSSVIYAFWVEKEIEIGDRTQELVDIVYFVYFPYNRGKEIVGTVWGNHVGDWEHITVRLGWSYASDTGWILAPKLVYVSAHDFGGVYDWASLDKTDRTHVVVYCAWGSHGFWKSAGDHPYHSIPWLGDLIDECSAGTAWDTWLSIEAFDYDLETGLGGSTWPSWMSRDFTSPGTGDPSDPASGPIFRWGNTERGCSDRFGACRLENGPTGPTSKGMWATAHLL